jgi:hypothetical protein
MSITTIMKCNICGKKFYSEYYEGGYISHCINFSDHANDLEKHSDEYMVRYLLINGNYPYSRNFIEERIKCFKLWKSIKQDQKDRILKKVEEVLKIYDTDWDIVEKMFNKLSDNQKTFIELLETENKYPIHMIVDDVFGIKDEKCDWGTKRVRART